MSSEYQIAMALIGSALSTETTQDRQWNRRLKILLVDDNAELGGGQLALVKLLQELDRDKFEPWVVLNQSGNIEQEVRKYAKTTVIPLEPALVGFHWGGHGFRLPLAFVKGLIEFTHYTRKLYALLKSEDIDVVHGNSLKAGLVASIASHLAQRPIIWHNRSRTSRDSASLQAVVACRILLRILPTFVIANSLATQKTLALPPTKPQAIVYSTIDTQLFLEAGRSSSVEPLVEAAKNYREIRFGVVGRITRWKGQHVFIEAAAAVHKTFPNTKFFIIGSSSADAKSVEYKASLHYLVDNLGMNPFIVFTGFQKAIHSAISDLHVLVNPSIEPEPIAQVAPQGLLAGKIVIASEGGGTPEIIIPGRTGVLVPMGSAEALAEAMIWVIQNAEAAQRMAEAGRELAAEMFSSKKITRQLEGIYTLLV